MSSEQRVLLLAESQETHCLGKKSLRCLLIWILVILLLLTLLVGLVILILEQAERPPMAKVECGMVEGIFDADNNVMIYKVSIFFFEMINKN